MQRAQRSGGPANNTQGCVSTGEQVLRLYAMDQYSIGECVLAMVGITVAFTALGYVVLKCVVGFGCLGAWWMVGVDGGRAAWLHR